MVEPARTAARRARSTILGALVVAGATLIGVHVTQSPTSSIATAVSPVGVLPGEHRAPPGEPNSVVPDGAKLRFREHRGALGVADGALPDGTMVFDDAYPGVANLDADLLGALRQAATAAADDGVEIVVDSGWRSPAYQERLLHEAVSKYGSAEEAARWVATAETSAHVSGDAVDVGPFAATTWLSEHGAAYGLCQIYRNEPWHYELRPEATSSGCPRMYADPTDDPRMQR